MKSLQSRIKTRIIKSRRYIYSRTASPRQTDYKLQWVIRIRVNAVAEAKGGTRDPLQQGYPRFFKISCTKWCRSEAIYCTYSCLRTPDTTGKLGTRKVGYLPLPCAAPAVAVSLVTQRT